MHYNIWRGEPYESPDLFFILERKVINQIKNILVCSFNKHALILLENHEPFCKRLLSKSLPHMSSEFRKFRP